MHFPIKVDKPYPSLEGLEEDLTSAEMIAPAYASLHSEFTAISQYIYHHFHFFKIGLEHISDTLENIAIAEMTHFNYLGTALINLGVDPVMSNRPPQMNNFFNTSGINYSITPKQMILDNIEGEKHAIITYKDMAKKLRNGRVAELVSRLAMDEELHLDILTTLLDRFN